MKYPNNVIKVDFKKESRKKRLNKFLDIGFHKILETFILISFVGIFIYVMTMIVLYT
jgi:hypothetical protein